ncbi:hypothetical protein FB45DRAFT_947857 [Roridomyces roridus]|uniref:F-box domain-containing protein n=1 Tax=Roridomyces roridus TaxID=1738132 RepID=A0AAD7B1V9_9AGAR|nr:hypothetical protein FB45DRAFT_947857 [Roridomyces roridus]
MLAAANELRARLERLDSEIAHHEESLGLLREARAGVVEQLRLEQLRGKDYPVLTLPFEITSQIFIDSLLAEDEHHAYPSPDEPPLVFTRVCRDWRTIALATPTLWRQIRIDVDSDDGPGHLDSKWVALLDSWLHRSEPHPIDVSIGNRSYTDPDKALVPVLNRYSDRWRDVELHLPFSHFPLLNIPALPLLERLTLSAHGSPDIINPISAFIHAPMLRHVSLEGGIYPSDILLPWRQLTSLEMHGASASDCLDLVRTTPNLQTCVLDIRSASHGLVLAPPLLALRSFTFSGPASWGTLRYLSLPALEHLDLTRIPPGNEALDVLLQRWKCRLREVNMYVRTGGDSQLHTLCLLRHLSPSLEKLELTVADSSAGNLIFHELVVDDRVLPQLTSVELRCMNDDNHRRLLDTVTAVLEKSPQETTRRITRFSVFFDTETEAGFGPELEERWRRLVASGVELRVENLRMRWI